MQQINWLPVIILQQQTWKLGPVANAAYTPPNDTAGKSGTL